MGATYGITQIQEGLDRRKVAKPDSYSIEFFDREDLYYREFPYRIQVIHITRLSFLKFSTVTFLQYFNDNTLNF